MDVLETISARYSVRAYRTAPVEEEKLEKVLEVARLAPTAANRQPFQVLVVHTKGRQEEAACCMSDERESGLSRPHGHRRLRVPAQAWTRVDGKRYADVDASIVMDHIILAVASLGLGTCWIGAFDPARRRTRCWGFRRT